MTLSLLLYLLFVGIFFALAAKCINYACVYKPSNLTTPCYGLYYVNDEMTG